MLNFINFLNDSNILTENCMLVSFDTVNMFSSIDNESGVQAVKKALEPREGQFLPTLCIIGALELLLKCNNSILIREIFFRMTVLLKIPICLVHMVTLPLNNLTKKHYNITLQLLVGKDFKMIFF